MEEYDCFFDLERIFLIALIAAGQNPDEFDLGGDKIYLLLPNLVPLRRGVLTPQHQLDNTQDSSVRVSHEHVHGKIINNWRALSFSHGLKIQLSKVSKWIEVGMILTNALTLLYGSQQHEFFQNPASPLDLRMPTIEDYFGLPSIPENYDYY